MKTPILYNQGSLWTKLPYVSLVQSSTSTLDTLRSSEAHSGHLNTFLLNLFHTHTHITQRISVRPRLVQAIGRSHTTDSAPCETRIQPDAPGDCTVCRLLERAIGVAKSRMITFGMLDADDSRRSLAFNSSSLSRAGQPYTQHHRYSLLSVILQLPFYKDLIAVLPYVAACRRSNNDNMPSIQLAPGCRTETNPTAASLDQMLRVSLLRQRQGLYSLNSRKGLTPITI